MTTRHHSERRTTWRFVLKRLWHEGLVARIDKYRYLEPTNLETRHPMPEGLHFEPITFENIDAIIPWKGRLHAWRFRILLNRGYVGLYARLDGRVVGYLWAVPKLHRWSPGCSHDLLQVGEVLGGRMEIHPDLRRRHIGLHARIVFQHALRHTFGDRLRYTWGTVLVENAPMQRMLARLGFKRQAFMRTYVILGHLYLHLLWPLEDEQEVVPNGRPEVHLCVKIPDLFFLLPMMRQQRPKIALPKEISPSSHHVTQWQGYDAIA